MVAVGNFSAYPGQSGAMPARPKAALSRDAIALRLSATAMATALESEPQDTSALVDRQLKTLKKCSFEAVLEDLCCRFIVNLPANELASIERIGFQVEQAYVGS